MIEPGIADIAAAAMVDWDSLRACPTCKRPTGKPCVSMSGRINGGQPDGEATPLPHAHVARKPRVRR